MRKVWGDEQGQCVAAMVGNIANKAEIPLHLVAGERDVGGGRQSGEIAMSGLADLRQRTVHERPTREHLRERDDAGRNSFFLPSALCWASRWRTMSV